MIRTLLFALALSFVVLPATAYADKTQDVLKAQVLLDRAHFSPGVIDGLSGGNMRRAINAYQDAHGMAKTETVDAALLEALQKADTSEVLVSYTITADDVKGPFTKVPKDIEKMATLEHLGFASAAEGIAEKFHMNEKLLRALNPGVDFSKEGTEIKVANEGGDLGFAVASIEVDKGQKVVRTYDASGKLLGFYPASIGSADKPAPTGKFTVNAVAFNPTYHFDAERLPTFDKADTPKLTIAAGPNSPVGVVWIDLSVDTYGIHGSPDAHLVGKTASHGCVRLTNWDAAELARAVAKDVPVTFIEAERAEAASATAG